MSLDIVAGKDGVVLLADTRPPTPEATVHALKVLRDTPTDPGGSRIAVLGEMPNLGAHADEAHLLVGRAAGTVAKPDSLILVGTDYARKIAAGAIREGFPTDKVHYFESADDAVKIVPYIVTGDDAVFIAGAGDPAMARIVAALGGTVNAQAVAPVAVAPQPTEMAAISETIPVPVPTPVPEAVSIPAPAPTPVSEPVIIPVAASVELPVPATPPSVPFSLETLPDFPPAPGHTPFIPPPPLATSAVAASPAPRIAEPLTGLFERERKNGFASFTDTDISIAVPISQKVMDELIAFSLASSPPIPAVSDLSVRFAGNDLITVQATVEKWGFRKSLVAEFRVERYIPFWQNPEIVLTLLTSGIIELVLNLVPLPNWVRVEGAKVRIHLGTLFTENNLPELNKLIREVNIAVRAGGANVTVRFCVGAARTPPPTIK